jgi:hypothetical protein
VYDGGESAGDIASASASAASASICTDRGEYDVMVFVFCRTLDSSFWVMSVRERSCLFRLLGDALCNGQEDQSGVISTTTVKYEMEW